jgi:hypothetical protein
MGWRQKGHSFIQSRGYSRTLSISGAIFQVRIGEPIAALAYAMGAAHGGSGTQCFVQTYLALAIEPDHTRYGWMRMRA